MLRQGVRTYRAQVQAPRVRHILGSMGKQGDYLLTRATLVTTTQAVWMVMAHAWSANGTQQSSK